MLRYNILPGISCISCAVVYFLIHTVSAYVKSYLSPVWMSESMNGLMDFMHVPYSRIYPPEFRVQWIYTPKIYDFQMGPQTQNNDTLKNFSDNSDRI